MIGDEFPLEVFFILVPRWKANLGHVDNSREKICSGGVLASVLWHVTSRSGGHLRKDNFALGRIWFTRVRIDLVHGISSRARATLFLPLAGTRV